jgi:predicted amidohydrolase
MTQATHDDKKIIAAAIQLDTRIGDSAYNLARCEHLAEQAIAEGASWIALPEFFNTGVNFDPQLVSKIETEEGISAQLLQRLSAQHQIVIGGSFMCRITNSDGSIAGVRNRYLCFSNGTLVGRHDKDLPTMWEAAFYEGGEPSDTGELGPVDGIRVGTAVCWEFLRTQTARRLQGKVDVIIGGSHWWSIPENWPAFLTRGMEEKNSHNFITTVQETARLIGAPVIHASHCGRFESKFPSIPGLRYQGVLEGHTAIIDGHGRILAHRSKEEGEGIAIAKLTLGQLNNNHKIPKQFWLRKRGLLPTISWHLDGYFGKRWYNKNVNIKRNNEKAVS